MNNAEKTPSRAERAHDVLRQMRTNPLDAIFAPKTIAVIGASEHPGSVGRAITENLGLFQDTVYLVNPNHKKVLGSRAFPKIGAVPERVDLAVIATPAATVAGIVRECVEADVSGAIVISAGFKECGKTGRELERELLAEAQRGKLRVIGPNCLGLMVPRNRFNATFANGIAEPGNVAFISQSGALCTAVLDWSFREKVGFSAFVSVGSMLDVGWGDLITYFGDDPHTRSIICYMESVGDARSFLSAAREVALSKPIIVLKVGHTEAAAKAAASHTGALSGRDAVLDAAFRRVGVLRVDSIQDLFEMAEALGKQPRPKGPRLAIVTNAGGPGALATDALVSNGGQLAPLSPETTETLNRALPPHWSRGNPIDILGDANDNRYAEAVQLAFKDPATDGVLVILTPQAMTDATATAERLKALAKPDGKPLLASWMGGPAVEPGEEVLNASGIPTFKYPDSAARAFALMWRYSDHLRALYQTPALPASAAAAEEQSTAARIIQAARKTGRALLTESESKHVLVAYGIPTVETHPALSEDAAVQRAQALGFPVVLKLLSETLTHKSDVGGVQLDLRSATAVRRAWKQIKASVSERAGKQHFIGVTVQKMADHHGYELILGSSVDPQFGPVLLFGAGGALVEVSKDYALGLPPLNATLARRLIEQTRIYAAFKGVRGQRPIHLDSLVEILIRFSRLVAEQPWISEIEINPLIVSPDHILGLDGRIVLHPPGTLEESLPRLAIRPYPTQYMLPWKLKDGSAAMIRPIRPEDESLMVKFHHTLSERSVYRRYFTQLRLDQRIAHERLSRICFIDYDREMALVVERRDPINSQQEIVAVGRLSKVHGTNEAEFALVVTDRWQGHGIGAQLLRLLVQAGRDEKLERIIATILPENYEMQQVARKAGFGLNRKPGDSELKAVLVL